MSGDRALAIGIDVGTSGIRAVAVDRREHIIAQSTAAMLDFGANARSPGTWRGALASVLANMFSTIDAKRVCALAVDGTSGTMIPVDVSGEPLCDAMMYNDAVLDKHILGVIAKFAPQESAARGVTSGLAKAMALRATPGCARILHQADWIAGILSGRFGQSDENNALKTGYDPEARRWPDWIEAAGMDIGLLPDVQPPGTAFGPISDAAAQAFGLAAGTVMVAGTTDGCASFLATGAGDIGDGVSALGSSLTIKVLSPKPVFAPQFGIYSHRIGDKWLAGGASNSGGKALAAHFSKDELISLSRQIAAEPATGLDYYPLPADGERFPFADPSMKPRLSPRPASDAEFLKGMFEGIAAIEALGYQRLAELGSPALRSVRSVGGGAANDVWTKIRQRKLGVPFLPALSEDAAFGTARLALQGAIGARLL